MIKEKDIELANKIKNELREFLLVKNVDFNNTGMIFEFLILKIAMLENELMNIHKKD
jgi:hypothetical protein